jgi:dipeptidyl aminopeptidase/acylaminoacyl peptidase
MNRNLLLIIIIIISSLSLIAQKKPFTIEDLYKVKNVGSPVVSPTGNKIAFTVTDYNLEEGKSNSDIYILYPDGATDNISSKDISETDPFWANDNELYFLADTQIHR